MQNTSMTIPFNAPLRQYNALKKIIDDAVLDTLNSGWYLQGGQLAAFEQAFARYVGVDHCVGVASGTDALILALKTIGCGHGSEVITVANAGAYASTAITAVDATPVYVDINANTFQMSCEALCDTFTRHTRAVIVTHLFGWMNDIDRFRAMLVDAGREDIVIIEDCAQAHGAEIRGKKAGSLGDIAAFSFYPTKNLGALGDAGAVVTSNATVAEQLRMLRQYGWKEKYHNILPRGVNSRMDELQAAILNQKLPHLDTWNDRRRQIVARYAEACSDNQELRLLHSVGKHYVAHLCVVQTPKREALRQYLLQHGIHCDIHYPVLDSDQPAFSLYKQSSELKHSKIAATQILSLPCFPEMTENEVNYVCIALKKFSHDQ